jgi:hypothetical protein
MRISEEKILYLLKLLSQRCECNQAECVCIHKGCECSQKSVPLSEPLIYSVNSTKSYPFIRCRIVVPNSPSYSVSFLLRHQIMDST